MSDVTWQVRLQATMDRLRQRPEPRLAVVGIGHRLRGDDAAGAVVARALRRRMSGARDLLVFDGGAAPESFCGPLRRFGPDLVILVDCAAMEASPGAIRVLPWDEVSGYPHTGLSLSLGYLAQYLRRSLGCTCIVLGIQPAQVVADSPLSSPVRQAVLQMVEALSTLLGAGSAAAQPSTGPPDPDLPAGVIVAGRLSRYGGDDEDADPGQGECPAVDRASAAGLSSGWSDRPRQCLLL